jgi:glucose/arabinose dehydrogenase
VGDMGNEEIDVIPPEGGRHYGWPFREGAAGHDVAECRKTKPDRGDCAEPAYYCRHDDVPGTADAGCKSINGGLIVDDCRGPDAYRGRYFFGDNANGRLWTLEPTPERDGIVKGSRKDVGQVNGFVVDMDVGPDGALYAAVMQIPPEESRVVRIAPKVPRVCSADGSVAPPAASAIATPKPATEVLSPMPPRRRGTRFAFLAIAAFALLVAAALVVSGSRKS